MAANPIPRTDTSISGAWPKGAHVVLVGGVVVVDHELGDHTGRRRRHEQLRRRRSLGGRLQVGDVALDRCVITV